MRDDEERMGPSYRIEWHIEVKMHLGKGNFCSSTLTLCCKTIAKVGARKPQKDVLRLGKMKGIRSRVGKA